MSPLTDYPRVSCMIAVYNGEAYLSEAIDSLLAQSYPNVEIVVVNDGSTDGTAEVMGQYGDRLCVLHQVNRGVSTARNRGVEMATGQLLCFLDADDRLNPRKFMMQAAALRRCPVGSVRLPYGKSSGVPSFPRRWRERDIRHAEPHWWKAFPGHISTGRFDASCGTGSARSSHSLRYAEDLDWFSRARDLPMRYLTLAEVLTHRRLHPGNVTAGSLALSRVRRLPPCSSATWFESGEERGLSKLKHLIPPNCTAPRPDGCAHIPVL